MKTCNNGITLKTCAIEASLAIRSMKF